jgi:hypothetical protein
MKPNISPFQMKIYIMVQKKSMHSKYWETRVESFHLCSEKKNPHRKISVVGVIVGFEVFIIVVVSDFFRDDQYFFVTE